jgi:hypothetical protein
METTRAMESPRCDARSGRRTTATTRSGASPTTGAVVETIKTGRHPADVAAGDVWVTIHEGGEVWRIHPS